MIKSSPVFHIGPKRVGFSHPVFIIAEIGVNHNGSIRRAKQLIEAAARAGADAVKFQKRHLQETYIKKVLDNPNSQENSFTYILPIFREFEFGRNEYKQLVRHAERCGVMFLCTPFDEPSVAFLEDFDLPAYKVASADLTNFVLLEKLAATGKPLIISTGMSTLEEIDRSALFLKKLRCEFAFLHCNSTYPAPLQDLHLKFIETMIQKYQVVVGYSGHEASIGPSLASVALGARILERHITFDKRAEGPDHAASLEPKEFHTLARLVRDVEQALGRGAKTFNRGEILNREVLGKSLVAKTKIAQGAVIKRNMLTAKSPGKGLSPQYLYTLAGTKARRDFKPDDVFDESDIRGRLQAPKIPPIHSRWGLKTRFAEAAFAAQWHPKLLEFHVSERDLDFPWDTRQKFKQEFYLHAPDYVGRRLVDLSSPDKTQRLASRDIIQRIIDKALAMAGSFAGKPRIILHLGGMDLEPADSAKKLVDLAIESLRQLDSRGVELLPENLPSRPWYFSGQWYQNAYMRAEDMIAVCRALHLGMTFDTSHAQLYCNCFGESLKDYALQVAPYVRHVHISDGAGLGGEGLQIGEGEINFDEVLPLLGRGDWSWVPEIWRGHHFGYHGFFMALERLAQIPILREARK